ncbi:MAG: glycoside hydrolase family 92 protein [Bacteroidetes bacterium]|nr:glycoside hydrolase family 92 protein [Bacteroidota bacterium]
MKNIKIVFLLIIVVLFLNSCNNSKLNKPTDFVNPFIGTGGHGHTYPGAALPFGMVQLSPDTRLDGWDGCGGYHYSDSIIYGFSHTHLSGTGCSDYGDILLMPTVGEIQWDNAKYASSFKHDNEKAKPGYYQVLLDKYKVNAELTTSRRVGFHKYTFPESKQSNILIDLKHRDRVIDSYLKITGKDELEGYRRSMAWATDQHVYFVAKFSKPFENYQIVLNDTLQKDKSGAKGLNIKAYVSFSTKKDEVIYVKVGISAVSIENARKNLETEIADWNFDKIRQNADSIWNKELSKIEVEGGTEDQKKIFYTSLYHSFLNPNTYSDVDGQYRGRDLKVHKSTFDYYTVFSLWDTYRAAHPLFTLVQQNRTADFIKTFIRQYEEGGLLPVWELSGNETGCMIGYHAVPVIVDAYMKGIRDFDVEKAYAAMKASAEQDKLGLKSYKSCGIIYGNEEGESVSKLLEYAYDDWCIAQIAKVLNKADDYKYYIERAQSYKNLLDPETGFMRARMNDFWFSPFDPFEVNFNYTEANAWQYSFYVPQDVSGFANYLGGKTKLAEKLDQLFKADSKTSGREQADITGLIGQYAHGNEPSHHIAYLYNFVGQPWKTQELIHRIQNEMYANKPDGLCGNEDCGQMSAWLVMSAMGFYAVTPGTDYYIIGTPMFKKTSIKLENGKVFTIKANKLSDKNFYISSAKLNGIEYNKSFITQKDIMNGGELVFEMSNKPSLDWGIGVGGTPETSITDFLITPIPFIAKGKSTFLKEQAIELGCLEKNANIYYTLDGSVPTKKATVFSNPISINKTTTIKAIAVKDGLPDSKMMSTTISMIPEGRSIKITNPYAPQYSAGGNMALIDLIRGGENFKTGTWQGYEGVDLEAVVDLGKKQAFKEITVGFLQDIGAWIFYPSEVEFFISEDGKTFKNIALLKNNVPENKEGVMIHDFTKKFSTITAKYVKVKAKNIGKCPPWHLGAGGKAWIFADEIVVK